jgi:hypothetical protein
MSRTLLFCAAVAIASIAATSWILLVGLAPNEVAVSFADLEAGIEGGAVREIRIEDRTYRFRTDGVSKKATGPAADIALVRSLRPSDKDRLPPKIYFEP